MKKLAAAILIALLFFNWCGYRLLTVALQQANNRVIEKKLDLKEYATADLVEISVPIQLPYAFDWADFERCDGEVTWHGVLYKYVERKLEKGVMHYRCLPNHETQRLQEAGNRFFAMVNDFDFNKKNTDGQARQQVKNPVNDFENDLNPWTVAKPAVEQSSLLPSENCMYKSPCCPTRDKPPCLA